MGAQRECELGSQSWWGHIEEKRLVLSMMSWKKHLWESQHARFWPPALPNWYSKKALGPGELTSYGSKLLEMQNFRLTSFRIYGDLVDLESFRTTTCIFKK